MKYLLVFGSLRQNSKRGYNWNRFGGQTFVKNIPLTGYEMYSVGPYPTICEGEGVIQTELHTVEDSAFKKIQLMERGAGYDEKTVIIDGIEASIFVWNKSEIEESNLPRVESGDWC
jgi:gamma-glutamylcyclotransferase (GGCT)/AIG2-like uncharacterized protein YtfP